MTDIYTLAGAKDKAAAKIREIAEQMEQQLRFYESLDSDFKKGYKQDNDYTLSTVQNLMKMASNMGDDALLNNCKANSRRPYVPGMSPGKGEPQGIQN